MDNMRANGIQTSIHYPPTHRFSYYQARYGELSLPKTEHVAEQEVTLPLYPGMGAEKVDLVVETVVNSIKSIKA
jgi:dTDP-4-amino-4,6-dideoxygalactose transaminase